MRYFVEKDSVVREIWGKSDTILLIFGGAAAEFALNKAVDWLYFTGRLPADPLGRLFSTVTYARQIVFADLEAAHKTIDKMRAIHTGIEKSRGATIPDWAYRDVLFMLIHYSIRSFELLERKLTENEKEEVFNVFYRVGNRMGLKGLPLNFKEWEIMHEEHLNNDLQKSNYTVDLYKQYKKHLGNIRYQLLRELQILLVPPQVNKLLKLGTFSFLQPVVPLYKWGRKIKLDSVLKALLLLPEYKSQINNLDNKVLS